MNKLKCLLTTAVIAILALSACNNKKTMGSLAPYADTAKYFAERIADIESRQDMSDIELYLQKEDSITEQRSAADEALKNMFSQVKDTLFLPFEQTKNLDKIKILQLWVEGIKYDKVLVKARVEAIDKCSFMGPHAGLSVTDRNKNILEVGGGIQGPTNDKLDAGVVYEFSGQIEHLHLLSDFKTVNFDEDIKKW